MPCGPTRTVLILSCEHGGHQIPVRYAALFDGARPALASHRGHDSGAAAIARQLAAALGTRPLVARTSRLLVDLNRSIGHPQLFSEFTRSLSRDGRRQLLARHYHPHRARVQARIALQIAAGCRVVHLACHSFAPELGGVVRNADIGLLFDSQRPAERAFCRILRDGLAAADATLRIRMNYPYRGTADGLTTALRRFFPAHAYLGIELECNQARLTTRRERRHLGQCMAAALQTALDAT